MPTPRPQMSARSYSYSGTDKERRVHLQFRIPFMTRWGQSLMLCGEGEFTVEACHQTWPVEGCSLYPLEHSLMMYSAQGCVMHGHGTDRHLHAQQ